MSAFDLRPEEAQQFDRAPAGAAEPVRNPRVELGGRRRADQFVDLDPSAEPDPAKWEVDIAYLTTGT